MNDRPTLIATAAPIGAPGQRPSFMGDEELLLKGLRFKVRQHTDRGIVVEVMMTTSMCPCKQERVWIGSSPQQLVPHPDGWCSDYLTAEVRAAQERVLRTRFRESLRVMVKGYWFAVTGINGCYLTLVYFGRSSKVSDEARNRTPGFSRRALKQARKGRLQ
jgi:hypothetical protein